MIHLCLRILQTLFLCTLPSLKRGIPLLKLLVRGPQKPFNSTGYQHAFDCPQELNGSIMGADTIYIWRNQTGPGLDPSICQLDSITLDGII